MFGPSPRSYGYALPGKVRRGGLVAALAQKIQDGSLVVVDTLSVSEGRRRKAATELLKRFGADGKALFIDVRPDEKLGGPFATSPACSFWRARAWARAT